jgi:hypothetical protein
VRTAAALFLISTAFAADRDWKRFPAVVEVDTKADVYAIGDAHSDFVRLTNVMKGAGLIDQNLRWKAGDAVLVVPGDMIDKGPRAVDVLRLLRDLRNGGHAIVLAGNHEAEFLADPHESKVKEFASQLSAAGMDAGDVAQCKGEIGEFLCSLPFAARVNDWYFSHAGNSGGRSLRQISADIESGFAKHGYKTDQLIGDESILEARLNGKGRKVWMDEGLPKTSERELLAGYAAKLGVKHIVEGHVPSEVRFADGVVRHAGEMFQRFGTLFLIDTGMSQGVDDSLGAALHITSTSATAICPDGKTTVLWNVARNEDSGRAAACGK